MHFAIKKVHTFVEKPLANSSTSTKILEGYKALGMGSGLMVYVNTYQVGVEIHVESFVAYQIVFFVCLGHPLDAIRGTRVVLA